VDELDDLRAVLPPGTADAWRRIAPVVPASAYLAGGTAIAVHLKHRVSRDLDFFLAESFDAEALAEQLDTVGVFAPTRVERGTVNGILGETKVQFLDARSQVVVEPLTMFAGIRIAGLGDLLATKLKVISDRGELRDYFDIMTIDTTTRYTVEQGLGLFLARYNPKTPANALDPIVRGLGYLEDVDEDPGLPTGRAEIVAFWEHRQPQVLRNLDTSATALGPRSAGIGDPT
jgi:hypothetical protein